MHLKKKFTFSLHWLAQCAICFPMQNNAAYKSKFHRDNTVSLWDIYQQRWTRVRASRVPAEILSSLSPEERKRIAKMAQS